MEKLYSQEALSNLLDNLRERFYALHNTVGVLSLSETPNNLLMWAHYAAGHTGFVLALDGFPAISSKKTVPYWGMLNLNLLNIS